MPGLVGAAELADLGGASAAELAGLFGGCCAKLVDALRTLLECIFGGPGVEDKPRVGTVDAREISPDTS